MTLFTLKLAVPSAIALAVIAGAPAAQATDPLIMTLNRNSQTVAPGGTLHFIGTITTNPLLDTLSQGGDALNPIGIWPAGITADDSPFLDNAPLSLAPNVPYTGDLFDVSVAPGTPAGIYSGTFQIEYDDPTYGYDYFGEQAFQVDVAPAVPEASSFLSFGLLLAFGIGGGMLARRKSAAKQKTAPA